MAELKFREHTQVRLHDLFTEIGQETHVMIAGASGSGKTVVEKGIILNLAAQYTPSEVGFYFIDPKKTVLHRLMWLPHVEDYADNDDDALYVLDTLIREMDARNKWCQKMDIEEYTGKELYCFIDETADIIERAGKDALHKFQLIVQMGRSAKIHMVFCSQSVSAKFIPSTVQGNISCTIGLNVPKQKPHISKMICGNSDCCKLPRYGKCVFINPEYYEVRDVPMYTDDDWKALKAQYGLRRVI